MSQLVKILAEKKKSRKFPKGWKIEGPFPAGYKFVYDQKGRVKGWIDEQGGWHPGGKVVPLEAKPQPFIGISGSGGVAPL